MIISMTGFGSAEKTHSDYTVKVEIRTLNSKFFDLALKLPKEFVQWEIPIKSLLEKSLTRGKASVLIEFQTNDSENPPVSINEELFNAYYKKYSEMAFKVDSNSGELFKLALHSPQVLTPVEDEQSLISLDELSEVIAEAAEKCTNYRKDEGQKLEEALIGSKERIEHGLETVKELDPSRIEGIKSRLGIAIKEIQDKVSADPNRFEQELIYYIEKLDITEEKVRLQSHLDYFDEILKDAPPHGKKLGFLAQEIGREINTIGSKANHANIQRTVVVMKEELEKIKEQILNVM